MRTSDLDGGTEASAGPWSTDSPQPEVEVWGLSAGAPLLIYAVVLGVGIGRQEISVW